MIDPDGILITTEKAKPEITMGMVPDCDFEAYDLDDEKDFKRYLSDVEKEVRGSFEYRQFIAYLRNYMDMNKCSFLENAVYSPENHAIRIEIHHYPFTLYDICQVVYNKREYYKESLDVEMVAKEVMELHYKCMVGLIPLSETVHELVHNGKLFIPIQNVFGRYDLFMDFYDPFISPEMKDIVSRIEKYSEEQTSELLNTTILDANNLSLEVKDANFQLPPINTVTTAMLDQIQAIKDNNYQLLTVRDKPYMLEDKDKEEQKAVICPIYWIEH